MTSEQTQILMDLLMAYQLQSTQLVLKASSLVTGLGMSGGTTTAATETADEVEIVLSGDPGADTTVVMKFIGISSSSDAS